MLPPIARRGRRAEPSEIVTVAMFHSFATRAGRYLENANRHRVAVWAEDDCRLYPRVTLAMLASVVAEAGARIGWLGFRMRDGEPRYGAHLVTFTDAALAVFLEQAPSFMQSRILALDTLLYYLWRAGYVRVPSSSLAFQHGHAARGRH